MCARCALIGKDEIRERERAEESGIAFTFKSIRIGNQRHQWCNIDHQHHDHIMIRRSGSHHPVTFAVHGFEEEAA